MNWEQIAGIAAAVVAIIALVGWARWIKFGTATYNAVVFIRQCVKDGRITQEEADAIQDKLGNVVAAAKEIALVVLQKWGTVPAVPKTARKTRWHLWT